MHDVTQHVTAAEAVGYAFPEVWRYLTKFGYFAGFGLALGAAFVHAVALRPALAATGASAADREVLRQRSAVVMAWMGGVFLVALYPQLAGKVARNGDGMPFGRALAPSHVWEYLSAPGEGGIPLGTMVLVQFALFGACALLMVGLALRPMRRHADTVAWIAWPGITLASVILSIAGDLGGQSADDWSAKIVDYVHVFAGCTWVGGIAALVGLGTAHRRLSPDAGLAWAQVWKRFSRVAQFCVAGVLISGLWQVWVTVGRLPLLFTTVFGRFLLLKLVMVVALLCIGAFNEYVLLPRIARLRAAGDGGGLFALACRHFPRVVAGEVALGAGVLLVMPFLNGDARTEGGVAPAHTTGPVWFATAVLVVLVALSFAANARVQAGRERLAADRPAAPRPEGERLAQERTPA